MPPEAKAFEEVVSAHYEPLYRFALGLSRSETDAADLTQRVFERFAEKSDTLRDTSKVKTWLFTTLYRDFLQQKRHSTKFPQTELDDSIDATIVELPRADVAVDANSAMAALDALEEPFRATLVLFYVQDLSYREIAEVLAVPIGTVMSRLARGKEMLRARMEPHESSPSQLAIGKGVRP